MRSSVIFQSDIHLASSADEATVSRCGHCLDNFFRATIRRDLSFLRSTVELSHLTNVDLPHLSGSNDVEMCI